MRNPLGAPERRTGGAWDTGVLSDLDALRSDHVGARRSGVPEARRAGEWLGRLRAGSLPRPVAVSLRQAGTGDVKRRSYPVPP